MAEKNVAVAVAKEQQELVNDEFEVLGVRVKLVSVPIGLIQDAQSHLIPPKVPMMLNETKGREEENPLDPTYLEKVAEYEEKRGMAAMDTMIMFGLVVDGLPETDDWLKRILWLSNRGTMPLPDVDFTDPIEKEFLFKKYVIATTRVIQAIGQKTGVSKEAITQAKNGFRPT